MTNIGSTCYMSAVLQVFSNVSWLSDLLREPADVRVITGRKPGELMDSFDPDGRIHTMFFNRLRALRTTLIQAGPQLSEVETTEWLTLCNTLNPEWLNERSDAALFFTWVLRKLNLVTDRSAPILKEDIWDPGRSAPTRRPAFRPEEEINMTHLGAIAAGEEVDSLQDHCTKHWTAHLDSGYQSQATLNTALQVVSLSECSYGACPTLRRDVSYDHQLVLRIPQDTTSEGPIELHTLIDGALEVHLAARASTETTLPSADSAYLDAAPACPNERLHNGLQGAPVGELTRRVTRIARAPAFFGFEIVRYRHGLPEGVGESDKFFHNRIGGYRSLSMQYLSNDGPSVRDKPSLGVSYPGHELLEGPNLAREYNVVAILAYSPSMLHYTSFVLINGRWVYFDDLSETPIELDPFTAWPEGFFETGLYYQVVGPTVVEEATGDVVMTTDEGPTAAAPEDDGQLQIKVSGSQGGQLEPEDEDAQLSATLDQVKTLLQAVSPSKGHKLVNDITEWFKSHTDSSAIGGDEIQPAEEPQKTPKKPFRRVSQTLGKMMGIQHDRPEPNTSTPGGAEQDPKTGGVRKIKDGFNRARSRSGDLLREATGLKGRAKTPDPTSPPKAATSSTAVHKAAQSPSKSSQVSAEASPLPPQRVIVQRPSEAKSTKRRGPYRSQVPEAKRSRPSLPRPEDPAEVAEDPRDEPAPSPDVSGRQPDDPFLSRPAASPYLRQGQAQPGSRSSVYLPGSGASPSLPEGHVQRASTSTVNLPRSEGMRNLAETASGGLPSRARSRGFLTRFSRHQKKRIMDSDDEEEGGEGQSKKSK